MPPPQNAAEAKCPWDLNKRVQPGSIFVAWPEHADAPHAVALLRAHREWPRRRAAEPSDEFAPPKANAHLPLPWPSRISTPARARLPRTGSRLRGEGLSP